MASKELVIRPKGSGTYEPPQPLKTILPLNRGRYITEFNGKTVSINHNGGVLKGNATTLAIEIAHFTRISIDSTTLEVLVVDTPSRMLYINETGCFIDEMTYIFKF